MKNLLKMPFGITQRNTSEQSAIQKEQGYSKHLYFGDEFTFERWYLVILGLYSK
jgi:hypothetical protein